MKSHMIYKLLGVVSLLLFLAMTACGGGGGTAPTADTTGVWDSSATWDSNATWGA